MTTNKTTAGTEGYACEECGYVENLHPIFISGRKVQEKGEIFLNWLCEEFKPSPNHSPSTFSRVRNKPEDDNNLIRKRHESNSEKREFVMGRSVSDSSGTFNHSPLKESGGRSEQRGFNSPNPHDYEQQG